MATLMPRRLGKFRVSRVAEMDESMLQVLRLIHDRILVFRCEMMYAEGALEYIAMGEDFDEVPMGGELPRYNVLVHVDLDPATGQRKHRIEFVKQPEEVKRYESY